MKNRVSLEKNLLGYKIIKQIIETTISCNYIKSWGVKEGLREILQNALDAHDQGNKIRVAYSRKTRVIQISNEGSVLKRSDLLLGTTTKDTNSSARGKWGEGFKIGSLALVRSNKTVAIYNGEEVWVPGISSSSEFETDVLKFTISNSDKPTKNLTFLIGSIEPKEWRDFKLQSIQLQGLELGTYNKTPQGKVLLDKDLKGKIYCGGLYVDTHKGLEYGYDFNSDVLDLNRDRNMAGSFNVQWNTSKMWAFLSANKHGKLFNTINMLKKSVPDVAYLEEMSGYTLTSKIASEFLLENKKAYPVTSDAEAKTISRLGYSPVYSSTNYARTVKKTLGNIEDLTRTVKMDYKIFHKITALDDANMKWVFEVMFKVDPGFELKMQVVKFNVDITQSTLGKGEIFINCDILSKKYDILHEVINHYSMIKDRKVTQVWKRVLRSSIENIEEDTDIGWNDNKEEIL